MTNKQFCHCVVPVATRGYRVGTDFTATVPAASCSFVFPPPQQLSVQHVPALPTHKHYWWLVFCQPAKCVCRDGCSLPQVEIQNSRIRTVCLLSVVPSRPFLQQCLWWWHLCVVSHRVEPSVNGYISNWINRLKGNVQTLCRFIFLGQLFIAILWVLFNKMILFIFSFSIGVTVVKSGRRGWGGLTSWE